MASPPRDGGMSLAGQPGFSLVYRAVAARFIERHGVSRGRRQPALVLATNLLLLDFRHRRTPRSARTRCTRGDRGGWPSLRTALCHSLEVAAVSAGNCLLEPRARGTRL